MAETVPVTLEVLRPEREALPTVRTLRTVDEFEAAVSLFCKVWAASSPVDLINSSTLHALSMSDNYVVGAFAGDTMVAAAVAFRGDNHLHSHLMGVLPDLQGRGYGGLLKEHQLQWALDRGYHTIRWTFDPLVRRNAHFNLWKLGASVLSYDVNMYGPLQDGINDGEETDRLTLEWTDGPTGTWAHKQNAAELLGREVPSDFDNRVATEIDATLRSEDGSILLVATPYDIETMRVTDHKRALQWRAAVREAFTIAREGGYHVAGFTTDGWYVFRR